jgi:hypothetical protein
MRQMSIPARRFSRPEGKLGRVSNWHKLDDAQAARFGQELQRELVEGHPLRGRAARAIARRFGRDDVAFEIDGALCVVHLTYAKETDPRWPRFAFVEQLPEDED